MTLYVALPTVDSVSDLDVTYDTILMFRSHGDSIVYKTNWRAKLTL